MSLQKKVKSTLKYAIYIWTEINYYWPITDRSLHPVQPAYIKCLHIPKNNRTLHKVVTLCIHLFLPHLVSQIRLQEAENGDGNVGGITRKKCSATINPQSSLPRQIVEHYKEKQSNDFEQMESNQVARSALLQDVLHPNTQELRWGIEA